MHNCNLDKNKMHGLLISEILRMYKLNLYQKIIFIRKFESELKNEKTQSNEFFGNFKRNKVNLA